MTVFRQQPGLAFARAGAERNFDVRTVAERKDSFSTAIVRVADLDGDGIVDLVVQKQVTHGVTSAATTNYVYLGRRGGGWDDKPNQILRSEGLGGIGLELLDVTGDGRPDLIMPTVVMGVWQIVRVLTTKTLKVNLQVFPFGSDRKFADKPSAERELRFHVALSGDGDLPAFDLRGDYNGDRRRDLAFGDDGDQIGFYLGQDGARLGKDAVEHANVNAAATVDPVDLDGKGQRRSGPSLSQYEGPPLGSDRARQSRSDPNHDHDESDEQKDMNEPTHGVRRDEAQPPQDAQQDR